MKTFWLFSVISLLSVRLITTFAFESLRSWVLDHGGHIQRHTVVCSHQGGEAGICLDGAGHQTKDPLHNETFVVAAIPEYLLLTSRKALLTSAYVLTLKNKWAVRGTAQHRMVQQLLLAVFIAEERVKGNKSFWGPYIAALPQPTVLQETLPVLWADNDLQTVLRGSYMLTLVRNIRAQIELSYIHGVCSVVPDFCRSVSIAEFSWALMIVRTRSFDLRTRGPATAIALVPFVDFLNHDATSSVRWECVDSGRDGLSYFVLAKDTLRERNRLHLSGKNRMCNSSVCHEIFMSYGTLDASKLLTTYGFVDEMSIWKATIILYEQDGPGVSHRPMMIQLTAGVDMAAANLLRYLRAQAVQANPQSPITEALGRLHSVIVSHLQHFGAANRNTPRSFPLDFARKSQRPTSKRYRYAYQYLIGELYVLQFWRHLVQQAFSRSGVDSSSEFEDGVSVYIYHHSEFRLARITGHRYISGGPVVYNLLLYPSGTQILDVPRRDILDEIDYIWYLLSW